jgi:Asp/Glu/hydantoin racemase
MANQLISPKIALIHATTVAIEPVQQIFAEHWKEAQCRNILDDSLAADLAAAGGLTAQMHQRMLDLARYAQTQGVQGILFTCSAFGAAIDAAQAALPFPVLKPNQAMFDEAIDLCRQWGGERRIGLVTSFAPAAKSMQLELEHEIALSQFPIQIQSACAPEAMGLLGSGNRQAHDQQVLAAAQAMPTCDVVLLGQFSMAHLQPSMAQALGKPVLTSPASAVRSLRSRLAA